MKNEVNKSMEVSRTFRGTFPKEVVEKLSRTFDRLTEGGI